MCINPADTNEKEAITDQKPNNHIALQPTVNQAVKVLEWNWARCSARHTAEIPQSGFSGTEHPSPHASSTNRSSVCIKASSRTRMYNWVSKRVSKTKLKLQNASAFLLIIWPKRSLSKFSIWVAFNMSTTWEKQRKIYFWLFHIDFILILVCFFGL